MNNSRRFQCANRSCRWTGTSAEKGRREYTNPLGYKLFDEICPRCNKEEFTLLPEPVITDRVEHANELIKAIASHGRKFFRQGDTVSHFELDNRGKVYFVDDYTRCRIYTHYHRDWHGFSHGGTLRGLVEAIREYIVRGKKLKLGYIAPEFYSDGSNLWGYQKDEAEKLISSVKNMPIVSCE